MALEDKCSLCGDVVFYCECPYTDPLVVDDKDYLDSPTFSIYKNGMSATWERHRRELFGDKDLVEEIISHLDGEFVEVLRPGFCLWMSVKEPYAVHFVAEQLMSGCEFSSSAPDWSEWTKPGEIY